VVTKAGSDRRSESRDPGLGRIGVGTWQWGDARTWGYGSTYSHADVQAAYATALDAGLRLFDTAEIYGGGASERILGGLISQRGDGALIASKYMPYPQRLRERALHAALDRSLARLDVSALDLYQIHWPLGLISHRRLASALARAVRDGRVRQVGVSNFSARQLRRMHAYLADSGVPLVSNQVEYSLVRRAPEVNGVLETCGDLGITLIAYSPLGQGLLTGKYDPAHRPSGARRLRGRFRPSGLRRAMPLIDTLRAVARDREATPTQVALAWLLHQERVLPIPGVKTAAQMRDVAGAAGLELDAAQIERLDQASAHYRTAPPLISRFVG
jgi:aryl-alcohol dehydrogenase-like predicted oxidoreductase